MTTAQDIGPETRIELHPLEHRYDDGEWIVGRMATGEFVALPDLGMQAIELLRDGKSVREATVSLSSGTGEEIDVGRFAHDLVSLGFVSAIDGARVPQATPQRPTLPGLRPEHLRFVLHPLVPVALLALVLSAGLLLVARPELVPTYRGLLWSSHGSAVIALTVGAGWSLLILHELAHLLVARATGVPGRIRFGTRLQFLVLQTDISGIELAPRRHRLSAYLAGIAVNLSTAAGFAFCMAAAPSGSTAHRLVTALFLTALLPLPFQFMIFMRTDLYFVLQDLIRCRDLFGDGRAYASYLLRRARHMHRGRTPALADPSAALPAPERRAVRVYSAVLVVGTVLCLAMLAFLTLPAEVALVADAVSHLGPDHGAADNLDGMAVLATVGAINLMWVVTKWRNRRKRVASTR